MLGDTHCHLSLRAFPDDDAKTIEATNVNVYICLFEITWCWIQWTTVSNLWRFVLAGTVYKCRGVERAVGSRACTCITFMLFVFVCVRQLKKMCVCVWPWHVFSTIFVMLTDLEQLKQPIYIWMHISGLLYLHLGSCCCAEASHSSRVQNLHSAGQDPRGGVWTLRGCLMAPFTIHLAFFWRVQVGNSPLFNVDFKYSGHEECESFGWVIAELPLCPAENFSCFHWYIHISYIFTWFLNGR